MASIMPACSFDEAPPSPERWDDAESADSASELLVESHRSGRGSFVREHGAVVGRVLAASLLVAAVVACMMGVAGGAAQLSPQRGDVGASTGLSTANGFNGGFLETPANAVAKTSSAGTVTSAYAPQENRRDGNVCADDEEGSGNLCYKKCSLLTSGLYPIRTSAWTCCESRPCGITNQRMSISMCNGFDQSGDSAGNGCPHSAGTCLEDEEFSLGMCYKKCSILTNGKYPYRVAAATCCEGEGLNCLEHFWHSKTSKSFDVGGGSGDGDKSTPSSMHPPLEELTEAATA